MSDSIPTGTVVCDAWPLIHLDELNQLSLLSDFAKICVPQIGSHAQIKIRRHRRWAK